MLKYLNFFVGGFFLLVAFYFFANPVASLSIIGVVATLGLLLYFLHLGRKALKREHGLKRWFTYIVMVWTLFTMMRMYFVVATEQLLLQNIIGYLSFLYVIRLGEGLLLWYRKEEGYRETMLIGAGGLGLTLVLYLFPVIGQFVLFNLIGLGLLSLAVTFLVAAYRSHKQKS